MLKTAPFHSLCLEELVLAVHLGCTAEERAERQEVRASVELRFQDAPQAITSDRLEDTLCYARISEEIRRHCEDGEFQLIERMGHEVYSLVREICSAAVKVAVVIHKVKPPVAQLRGGTFYRCGDFLV